MKRKSLVAAVLLLVMLLVMAGCNYVSRPVGAGNNASDSSSMLAVLLEKPKKTTVEQATIEQETGNTGNVGNDQPSDQPSDEPTDEPVSSAESPFATTTDVFSKIDELLQQVSDEIVDAKSATGVSDELMSGRTVYVYTPYDISGKDNTMMKSVANKLNMTVVVNNLNQNGALYSAKMKKIVLSGTKADLMFVDQNTWGDIQYYTQPLTSFVNFDLGDKLGSFHKAMSANFSISDNFYKSEQSIADYYVASGIGAPYLLAYNRDNLVTTGKLEETTDEVNFITMAEVKLADPVQMYKDKTWSLGAMQKMLTNSTVGNCVGLATLKDTTASVNWWFGCDNVAGFKLNVYSKAALTSAVDDYFSPAGYSRFTLDTIQDLYWNNVGANKMNVAKFIQTAEKEKAITKLFNTYAGSDADGQYAMLGIEASDLTTMFSQAGKADWDFVPYPYGTATENLVRSSEPVDGNYLHANGEDTLQLSAAGWASGFAVLERCGNPAVALRFAEDYTLAWQDDYEGEFMKLLSEEQKARYEDMKKNMGVTFYTSMMSHVTEAPLAFPGAAGKVTANNSLAANSLAASSEFASNPALFTQPIFDKNTALGSYNPQNIQKWSDFIDVNRANGMSASYQLARAMFNY